MNSRELIPKHKHDHDSVNRLRKLSKEDIRPVIPELLVWLQDGNWPVSLGVQEVLAPFGTELIPHIRNILESDDGEWKYFLLTDFFPKLPHNVLTELKADLIRLEKNPSQVDKYSEIDQIAHDILCDLELHGEGI